MNQSYYYYEGSLDVPPCTENVAYVIMDSVNYINYTQLSWFNNVWLKNPNFSNQTGNNRPIQNRNSRNVYYYLQSYESYLENVLNPIV